MKSTAVIAVVCVAIVLIGATNNTKILDKRSCITYANGYCLDISLKINCPPEWDFNYYSGCGSGEMCCHPKTDKPVAPYPGVNCRAPYQQGHCIDQTKYRCPSTHYPYYTGCGALHSKDVCCYPKMPRTTQAPVTVEPDFKCIFEKHGYCVNSDQRCPIGYVTNNGACKSLKKCCYLEGTQKPATLKPYTANPTSSGFSSVSQCGRPTIQPNPNGRIVGGDITTVEAHPWHVQVRKRGYHHCGGSLVKENWVLTAAHCVYGHSGLDIVVGTSTKSSYDNKSQRIAISQQIMHPLYRKGGPDLALLKLSRPVDLTTTKTRAICLPESTDTFDSETCIVSGWGATSEGGPDSEQLKHVALPMVNTNTCKYYMGHVPSWVLCAGAVEGGEDACQGDSGGPLICRGSDGVWKQAGVVSNGHGCARPYKFGLYSNVAKYRSWIDEHIAL